MFKNNLTQGTIHAKHRKGGVIDKKKKKKEESAFQH